MALKKKPVNGMKDILPAEARLRDYAIGVIKETYRRFGFFSIETPVMEDIENLLGSKGGENEKLIFKVLKRGEKLNVADATKEEDVVDFGLRYDLTVPLSRYYACHESELITPFKALQIGNVWRADRPQKGRYRQFTQCDIDILGEPSNLAEIELLLATSACIGKLGFKNFEIRINDRQILSAMAIWAGFDPERLSEVYIELDKIDKAGAEKVSEKLVEMGFKQESCDKYMSLFDTLGNIGDFSGKLEKLKEVLSNDEATVSIDNLQQISEAVEAAKEAEFDLVFDPTLVRGMGYYTGTIFEISLPEFSSSCGGGGRYDKLVGSFLGKDVPACGFSIGFERIIMLLMEKGIEIPDEAGKKAYLIDKGYPKDHIADIFKQAAKERAAGVEVLIARMNKNKKFQKETLRNLGYEEFVEFYDLK